MTVYFWFFGPFFLCESVCSSGSITLGLYLYEFLHTAPLLERNNHITSQINEGKPTNLVFDGLRLSPVKPFVLLSHSQGLSQGRVIKIGSSKNITVPSPWFRQTTCKKLSKSGNSKYRFLLCLDYADRLRSSHPCQLGRVETEKLISAISSDRDIVTFPPTLGMTYNRTLVSNPVVFGFDRLEGAILLRIFVTCCDVPSERNGECQETLSVTINQRPTPTILQSTNQALQSVVMSGRASLVVYLTLQCDVNFFRKSCDTYCKVEFPTIEHALCNKSSGEKHCQPGWAGPNCRTDKDECQLYKPCQNNGECLNIPSGSFTCNCQLGTTGVYCQDRVQACIHQPCKNGGSCHETAYGYLCFCLDGYGGHTCEQPPIAVPTIARHFTSSGLNKSATTGTMASTKKIFSRENNVTAIASKGETKENSWRLWLTIVIGATASTVLIVLIVLIIVRRRHNVHDGQEKKNGSLHNITDTKCVDDVNIGRENRISISTNGSSSTSVRSLSESGLASGASPTCDIVINVDAFDRSTDSTSPGIIECCYNVREKYFLDKSAEGLCEASDLEDSSYDTLNNLPEVLHVKYVPCILRRYLSRNNVNNYSVNDESETDVLSYDYLTYVATDVGVSQRNGCGINASRKQSDGTLIHKSTPFNYTSCCSHCHKYDGGDNNVTQNDNLNDPNHTTMTTHVFMSQQETDTPERCKRKHLIRKIDSLGYEIPSNLFSECHPPCAFQPYDQIESTRSSSASSEDHVYDEIKTKDLCSADRKVTGPIGCILILDQDKGSRVLSDHEDRGTSWLSLHDRTFVNHLLTFDTFASVESVV